MPTSRLDRTTVIGLVTTIFIIVASALVFSGNFEKLLGDPDERSVTARFASTGQLRSGDEVRVSGVRVGQVESIEPAPDGRFSSVAMRIETEHADLYKDASASVRWRTVLGAAFYVNLQRGSRGSGPLGEAAIPLQNTTSQVELDDITTVVNGGARTGLQRLPGELADALADPAAVAGTLDTVQSTSPEVERVARALRGTEPDRDLQRLVDGTARTMDVLGRDHRSLRALVEGAAATLQTTAARADDIRATFALAPAMMRSTHATLARLEHTLDVADPVLSTLNRVAPAVAPTVAKLRPTVEGLDRLLRRARPLLRDLPPTVRSVVSLASRGRVVLHELAPTLTRLDKTVLPGFARKWPETGISTTVMTGAALAGLGGIAGQKDANGHFVRFPLTGGSGTVLLPCNAFPNDPDMTPQQQIQCQNLSKTLSQVLSYKPLSPPPGSEGSDPPPGNGSRGRR